MTLQTAESQRSNMTNTWTWLRALIQLNLEKGKTSKSIACMKKIAASILLNLFINGIVRWHTTDAP